MPDFAMRPRIVRIEAHQGGHVEGDAQPGLSVLQKIFEPAVGSLGIAEAGKLPHGPEPAAVHRGVRPSREWELPWDAELFFGRPAFEIAVVVARVDLQTGERGEARGLLTHASILGIVVRAAV